MRKLRVNIFDDDVNILKLLKIVMAKRDYEILTFDRPTICPIHSAEPDKCNNQCADIIMTDYQMPQMTGLEMLLHQSQNGCKVDIRNKMLMSADLDNEGQKTLEHMGCKFFSKPFQVHEILAWLDDCEKRIDLSQPIGVIRKEARHPASIDIRYKRDSSEKTYIATVTNYSDSGLFIKTDTCLNEKLSIAITTELPIACNIASISWTKEMSPGLYMAGCSCS